MRKLPLYVERAMADVQATKMAIASKFEWRLRRALAEIKSTIMCSSGCAHCCYYPIPISVFEGLSLYQYLVARGQWTPSLKKVIQEHADQTFGLSSEIWYLSHVACPFLDKADRCAVYKARPFACHVTYSNSDPLLCHPHNLASGVSVIPRAEPLTEFHTAEERLFKQNRAHRVLMPVSKAVLIAELVASGAKPFENLDAYIRKEFEDHV